MRGVFTHAVIFGLAPLLRRLVGLVMVPIYTHYLSPSDYGEIELLSMATGLLALVLSLELRAGYMRSWLAAPDPQARASLLSAAVCSLGTLGVAGMGLLLLIIMPFGSVMLGHRIGWWYAALLAVGVFADVLSLVFNATLQALLRSTLMVTLSVAQFAVSLGITAYCVVQLRTGPVGFFMGGVTSSLLGLAVMAWVCFRRAGWATPD